MSSPAGDPPDAEQRAPWADATLALLFLLAIAAPAVVQAFSGESDEVFLRNEQREPTPRPELPTDLASWARFPESIDDWYGERFGLRNELLFAHQWLKLGVLGESPADHLMIGEDDWVFTSNHAIRDSNRGARPFRREELDAWRESIERRRDWLASRGIDYVFCLVPSKAEVYPEKLPPAHRQAAPNRRDQFLDELRTIPDLVLVDLREHLRAQKDKDRANDHVYYPLGGHWTPRGALAGYQELMRALPDRHRGRPLLERSEFEVAARHHQDDMTNSFLYRGGFRQAEPGLRQVSKRHTYRQPGRAPDGSCWFRTWRNADESLTRLFLQRDSFGTAILPFLAEHFSEVTELNTLRFSPELMDVAQPDVVIELFVDHTLSYQVPHVQRVFGQAALAERFDALPDELLSFPAAGRKPKLRALRSPKTESTDDGVRVESEGASTVELPDFTWRTDRLSILRLEVTSPADGFLTLYYPIDGLNLYRDKQSSNVPLRAGRQVLFVELPPQQREAPIALTPGCAAGTYVIHAVEAREGPF